MYTHIVAIGGPAKLTRLARIKSQRHWLEQDLCQPNGRKTRCKKCGVCRGELHGRYVAALREVLLIRKVGLVHATQDFAIGAYKKLWNPTPCHLTQWLRFLCLYLDVLDVVFRNHNLILSVCRTFRFPWLAPFTTLYSLLSRCLSRWCSIFHNTLHGRCQTCLVGHLETCVHDLYSIVKFRWNPETDLFCRRNFVQNAME